MLKPTSNPTSGSRSWAPSRASSPAPTQDFQLSSSIADLQACADALPAIQREPDLRTQVASLNYELKTLWDVVKVQQDTIATLTEQVGKTRSLLKTALVSVQETVNTERDIVTLSSAMALENHRVITALTGDVRRLEKDLAEVKEDLQMDDDL